MALTAVVAKALVAASLLTPAAVDRSVSWPPPERGTTVPAEQKDAVMKPLESSATECIARTVSADPRLPAVSEAAEINKLIVESVPRCADALRSMIDTYDRLYGDGAGETFFMGPYLDDLPSVVDQLVRDPR